MHRFSDIMEVCVWEIHDTLFLIVWRFYTSITMIITFWAHWYVLKLWLHLLCLGISLATLFSKTFMWDNIIFIILNIMYTNGSYDCQKWCFAMCYLTLTETLFVIGTSFWFSYCHNFFHHFVNKNLVPHWVRLVFCQNSGGMRPWLARVWDVKQLFSLRTSILVCIWWEIRFLYGFVY